MEDRKGLAPEPLAAEEPVAEFVVHRRPAEAGSGQIASDLGDKNPRFQAGVGTRRDGPAVASEKFFAAGAIRLQRFHHRENLQTEGGGEFEIAIVVGRDGHDRSRAVGGENIIGHPHGNRLTGQRVDAVRAGEDAGFSLRQIGSVEIALAGGRLAISPHRFPLRGGRQRINERVFRSHHEVGDTIERVGAGGVDPQDISPWSCGETGCFPASLPVGKALLCGSRRGHEEIDLCSAAFTDPVTLQFFDARGPVEPFEFAFQPIGIRGDPQHPLPQRQSHHGMAAAFAHAADDFLIGQHGAEGGAPVHRRLRLVGQPVRIAVALHRDRSLPVHLRRDRQFGQRPPLVLRGIKPGVEQHQKNPLRPPHILGIGRGQFPLPVVAEAEHLQLAAEGVDVALGTLPGGSSGADRILLGGESEGIESHRVHDRCPPHALESGDDVGGGVALRMPHMQAVAAGVGEHVENVGLFGAGQAGRGEGAMGFPPGLPFGFYPRGLVAGHRGDFRSVSGRGHPGETGQPILCRF